MSTYSIQSGFEIRSLSVCCCCFSFSDSHDDKISIELNSYSKLLTADLFSPRWLIKRFEVLEKTNNNNQQTCARIPAADRTVHNTYSMCSMSASLLFVRWGLVDEHERRVLTLPQFGARRLILTDDLTLSQWSTGQLRTNSEDSLMRKQASEQMQQSLSPSWWWGYWAGLLMRVCIHLQLSHHPLRNVIARQHKSRSFNRAHPIMMTTATTGQTMTTMTRFGLLAEQSTRD